MRAAVVTRYGAPGVLRIMEVPEPVPGPGQVVVRVRAIGLNFADIFGRMGVYPNTPRPPFVPGLEFSGEVASAGNDVTSVAVGQRVMGYSRLGSHAEYVLVNKNNLAPLADRMTFEEGAAFLATGLTAYHGIVRLANLRKGEKILVHAAAGGVGLATLQLARDIGAEIFATSGTDEKASLALRHGAHYSINYTASDFSSEVLRLSDGYGVDVVMDAVGGEVFRKSWRLLAQMGRYVLYGISSVTGQGGLSRLRAARTFMHMHPVFPASLISANKALMGFNLGTLIGKERYFREAAVELARYYQRGVLRPVVGKVFPFEQIGEAHAYLQSRQSVGKVVVTVS